MSIAVINVRSTCENIKWLMTDKGVSQRQLAETLNISIVAVNRWMNLHALPSIDHLIEIAYVLQCPLDSIVAVDYIDDA